MIRRTTNWYQPIHHTLDHGDCHKQLEQSLTSSAYNLTMTSSDKTSTKSLIDSCMVLRLLPPPKKEDMFLVRSVCLFVCLSVRLSVCPSDCSQTCERILTKFFWRGRAWLKDQVIQFWWRSGSRFGCGSPKSEIRILRIGGRCALSVHFLFCIDYVRWIIKHETWHHYLIAH